MHGASEQCMHATEMDFSPGKPSFRVTTRLRFTPHGTSCSCLQAVTQPLHSMQRSASQMNFILAMSAPGALRQARCERGGGHAVLLISQRVVFVSCIIVTLS